MKRIKVLKAYFVIWLFVFYIVYAYFDVLSTFFMATVIFSSAVMGLLIVGSFYQIVCGYEIMMLGGTFGALAYKKTGWEFYLRGINKILPATIAHLLQVRKSQEKMMFTPDESKNIIDWLEGKFHKQKAYINFFINTSMLIGLLGTFVGLVESIDAMGEIILSLNGDVEISEVMKDFSAPLSGMAIGFGASLFGVVAAVILGINGYVLFKYQDTLIDGIEDWLKERIIDVVGDSAGGSAAPMGGGSDLPEGRKSFLDIFLEQMTTFSGEIRNLSSSNRSFESVNQTLLDIKTLLEEDRQYKTNMLGFNELTKQKFEQNEKLITNAYASLDEIKTKMDSQKGVLDLMLEASQKTAQNGAKAHGDEMESLGLIAGHLSKGVTLVDNLSANFAVESKNLSQKFENITDALSSIESQSAKDRGISTDILNTQVKLTQETHRSLGEISSGVNSTTATLEEIRARLDGQREVFDSLLDTSEKALHQASKAHNDEMGSLDLIAQNISNESALISTLSNMQTKLTQETHDGLGDVSTGVRELSSAIAKSNSLLTAISNQSHTDGTKIQSQISELSNLVSQMSEFVSEQKNSLNKILQSSVDTTDINRASIEKTANHFAGLTTEIEKIDRHLIGLRDDVKLSDEGRGRALDSIGRFGDKLDDIKSALDGMSVSIKGLAGFEVKTSSGDSGSGGGFFSSLFGKKD